MAFINNTPMIVGGGTPTPTPSGKKYKLKMKNIPCSVTISGGKLTITPNTNTEFKNFYNWLREFPVPRPFILMIKQGNTTNYGMHPSYPVGRFEQGAPIQLSFSSGRLSNSPPKEAWQIHIVNALVNQKPNAITVSNNEIYLETTNINSSNEFVINRSTLSNSGNDLKFILGIPVIEESEE